MLYFLLACNTLPRPSTVLGETEMKRLPKPFLWRGSVLGHEDDALL